MTFKADSSLLSLPVLLVVSLLLSCNTSTTESSSTDDSDTAVQSNAAAATPGVAGFSPGQLDTLWLDSSTFNALPSGKKIVFTYTFLATDTLTLHGWIANNTPGKPFDSLPNVKLQNGRPSGSASYGNGTYFNSLTLKGGDVQKIKNAITAQNAQYVLFIPEKLGDNIKYLIYVRNEAPAATDLPMAMTAADAELNPSPPKSY